MYAEITIHFADAINRDRLFQGMPVPDNPATVLDQTVFRTTPDFAAGAIYSRRMPSTVFLVFQLGADSLNVHLENTVDRGSIAKLKGAAEDIVRTMSAAGKRAQCTCDDAVIRVHAEDNLMQEGRRPSARDVLVKRFRETVVGDVLVGAATAITGLVLGVEVKNSIITGIAVIVALVVWLLIEVVAGVKRYEYDDV